MLYRIRDLQRVHGQAKILDIAALDITAGKVYTLIGPNGAGKTTLLHTMAFLEPPSQGKITFMGQEVQFNNRCLQKMRQKVVLVDQYPILFTGSVRKNVEYGLKLRKIGRAERRQTVERVLDMVGMLGFVNADAQTLSGGETKRVALARALAIGPQVLLCDEPTANVDVENQEIILDILKRSNRDNNLSLIFATHSLSEAAKLADHTIVLQNGRLSSAKKENVFSCRRLGGSSGTTLLIGGTLEYVLNPEQDVPESCNKVHLDPRTISCTSLAKVEKADGNNWRGSVKKVEKHGQMILLVIDCGIDLVVKMERECYQREALLVDQPVGLRVKLEPAMFFAG